MTAAMAVPSFQVGDRVTVVKDRFNAMHHTESYKAGERGVVVHAADGSSVVQVRLDGAYEVVESVLPLLKRPVPHRMVSASILHLDKEKPPALPPAPPPIEEGPPPLLAVEEAWLKAIFKRCDTGGDNRVNQQELLQSCADSPDVGAFFGLAAVGGGGASQGAASSFEASFKTIAGNDLQISWQEMCAFYRQRLVESSVANNASGNEQDDLYEAEEAKLREIFEKACRLSDSAGSAGAAALREACRACADPGMFLSTRRRIRNAALQDVTAGVVEGVARMIGGDDGDITLAEVCNFAVNLDSDGLSLAEQAWLDGLFKKAHDSGFSVADSQGKLVAREGEAMSKAQFVAACRETPESCLLFGLKRKLNKKRLEDATRDALATVIAPAGGGGGAVGWPALREAYLAAVRGGRLAEDGAAN